MNKPLATVLPASIMAAAILALLCCAGPAMAQAVEPIGSVQEAQGAALAVNTDHQVLRHRHFRAASVLAADAPVFAGDRLVTGPDGGMQVFFADGTVLAMGPQSTLVLDELVYGSGEPGGDLLIFSLGPGLFRTVTGEIARDDPTKYRLQTPLGVIGVRGTEIASLVRVSGMVPGSDTEGARPFDEVMREQVPFLFGQPLGLTEHVTAFLEELRAALEISAYEELHVHVAGSLERMLEVSDSQGLMALLARAQGVHITRDGLGDAGPCDVTELAVFDLSGQTPVCTEQEIRVLNTVRIDRRLPVPRLYQIRYGDQMGGGSEGTPMTPSQGAGGGNTGGSLQGRPNSPTNRN